MKIAIDAHMVGERETGNETYTLNLIRALLEIAPSAAPDFRFLLYTPRPEELRSRLPVSAASKVRRIAPAASALRIPFSMPMAAARDRVDLLHVNYTAPPVNPCPFVVTIHDLSFEVYPRFFSLRDLLVLKTLVPITAGRAAHVITVSNHARSEILARYGVPPDRVSVTYEAAADRFQPEHEPEALTRVRERYGLGERFILALGNLQPRKNLGALVEAFARLKGAGALAGTRLALAGKPGRRGTRLRDRVERLGLSNEIRFTGYVDDADLPALYGAALFFVYPSLYEGFGLPPLEAMACGTPVLSSNAASLPEVVGDAAVLFEPTDVDALAAAMARLAADPALRRTYARAGVERAARFRWRTCAEETLKVYAACRRQAPAPRSGRSR